MADLPDVVAVRPREGRRWSIPGGSNDEGGVTLHVVVVSDDGSQTRRYQVEVPLEVGADCALEVGAPVVTDAFDGRLV